MSARPYQLPAQLSQLIRYVSADQNEESDWIEWKSELNLSDKSAAFCIAKNIIGFANRDPFIAKQNADGHAYLVVGAEPGNILEIPIIDPADLEKALREYLGPNPPRWQHYWHRSDIKGDRGVLVIEVFPRRPGDPIYTTHKSFNSSYDGTVFSRFVGETRPLKGSEFQHLYHQLKTLGAPDPDLQIQLECDLFAFAARDHNLQQQAEVLGIEFIDRLAHECSVEPADILRTSRVTQQDVAESLVKQVLDLFESEGLGPFVIRLINATDTYIKNIQMQLLIRDNDGAFCKYPELADETLTLSIPEQDRFAMQRQMGFSPMPLTGIGTAMCDNLTLSESNTVATFEIGDLRHFAQYENGDLFLILNREAPVSIECLVSSEEPNFSTRRVIVLERDKKPIDLDLHLRDSCMNMV